jgi:hypothetical protein
VLLPGRFLSNCVLIFIDAPISLALYLFAVYIQITKFQSGREILNIKIVI